MLTIETLTAMEPATLIASGTHTDPDIFEGDQFKWIAVRGSGSFLDWKIYCADLRHSEDYIRKFGNKVKDNSLIKELVPCTDEVFALYAK